MWKFTAAVRGLTAAEKSNMGYMFSSTKLQNRGYTGDLLAVIEITLKLLAI